ncbi:hypothetical protein [Paenibacillus thalictri]|uniref:Uncharacterized protein n=1 Tax=Paenibacillus thalictri TaxID=2527873 RepID=A0A4V2J4T9_9BACL|nr:hypothetical protein [Paenibacillus thalictri]TBL81142.1 hypothetical protein EYB31_03345 [Paenibacillus thalictri]
MNEKQAAVWQKKRQLGKIKYAVFYGLMPWGIILAIVFSLLEFTTQGVINWRWIIARLIVFGFIGFFLAGIRWNTSEQKFKLHQSGAK